MATVIVVDDDPTACSLMASWLISAGHTVTPASSASEARKLFTSQTDVLLCDINVAISGIGFDLLEWIRTNEPSTAVVLSTAVPAIETAIQAVRMNAYDLLVKPVPEAAVLRSVGRAAEHSALLREKLRLEEENRLYQHDLEQLVEQRTHALERRTRQLLMLHQVAQSIGSLQQGDQVYQHVVEAVHQNLGYQGAAIYELDEVLAVARLKAIAGTAASSLQIGYEQSIREGLLGRAAGQRQLVVSNDVHQSPDYVACSDRGINSQAVFPVFIEGALSFLLQVSEDQTNAFDDTDVTVLQTLADNLGVVLANVNLYARLRDSLMLREQILQNVSHELRTPLTLISGYAEFMIETLDGSHAEPALETSLREMTGTIVEQTENLTALVDQLIAFQRIEREDLSLEPLQIEQWLTGMVAVWQPVLIRHGITLELHVDQPLGQVLGDWDYLTQVLQNLLDNARKFSPNGGKVKIASYRSADKVTISIEDQGIGVSPERIPFLFERFYQADSGVTRRYGGMGLGLALVSEIINKHNGRIWAESEGTNRGLLVTFELPALD